MESEFDLPIPGPEATPATPQPAVADATPDPLLQNLQERLASGKAKPMQKLIENLVQVVDVTVGELRAAAARYPLHPKAIDFLNATVNYPDDMTVHVEQPDIQALLENKTVRVIEEISKHDSGHGQMVDFVSRRKVVV